MGLKLRLGVTWPCHCFCRQNCVVEKRLLGELDKPITVWRWSTHWQAMFHYSYLRMSWRNRVGLCAYSGSHSMDSAQMGKRSTLTGNYPRNMKVCQMWPDGVSLEGLSSVLSSMLSMFTNRPAHHSEQWPLGLAHTSSVNILLQQPIHSILPFQFDLQYAFTSLSTWHTTSAKACRYYCKVLLHDTAQSACNCTGASSFVMGDDDIQKQHRTDAEKMWLSWESAGKFQQYLVNSNNRYLVTNVNVLNIVEKVVSTCLYRPLLYSRLYWMVWSHHSVA